MIFPHGSQFSLVPSVSQFDHQILCFSDRCFLSKVTGLQIHDIKYHLGQPRPEFPPEINLQERLGEAECVLQELKELVQTILSKPQDSTSLRRYNVSPRLRRELHDIVDS